MNFKKTSLEHLSDEKLLYMLEMCDGKDSPLFLECLRRIFKHKIKVENEKS